VTAVPRIFEGNLTAPSGQFAIVVSRYNESITRKLLDGALASLVENGVDPDHVDVVWVPGAFEIPLVADRMAKSRRYLAVICLGAVIRGETTHDQHINRAVSVALGQAGLGSGVPVLFGVLSCDTLEQAIHRSGGNVGNKGSECALAALEMANLLAKLA
jgi:6,7-dimethyl-8-ribityllumazine synthase